MPVAKLHALKELIELGEAGCLTQWERGFVENVSYRFRNHGLSEKEEVKIEQIYKKHLSEEED